MQYVVLLMHRGWAPYRDIVDVNMPGAYLVQDLVNHVFGAGAIGWRIFDFMLSIIGTLAMIAIAPPPRLFPGIFAGMLFALMHGADGPAQAGQRDLLMAILLVAGYAFLFWGLRRGLWLGTALFGICAGYAATIKPQAAFLGIALLCMAGITLRKRNRNMNVDLLWGAAGLVFPSIVFSILLARKHALGSFLATVRGLDAYHAHLARHSLSFLAVHAIPPLLLPLTLLAIWTAIINKYWRTWEGAAILLGICFGFMSFCIQGKAYPYHRYPLLVFLLLFIAIQLTLALRTSGLARAWAYGGFIYGVLWIAPASTAKALRYDWRDQSSLLQLESDLKQMTDGQLSGEIQCMDTTAGCITVLNRMKLTQSTGFLYDCYFFSPASGPEQQRQRQQFWEKMQERPPKILVVVDRWCFNLPAGYEKLKQWPQFDSFLTNQYVLLKQHDEKPGNYRYLAAWPFGYRIYARR